VDLRVARELGLDALQVLLRRRNALPGNVEPHPRLLQLLLRGDLLVGEIGLALELLLGVVELALRRLDLLPLGAPLRAQAPDVGPRRLDLGVDLGKRQAIGLVVELEQELVARHALVLLHGHLDDEAAELGRDLGAIALHVGIVGRYPASGRQPDEDADGQHDRRQRPHDGPSDDSPLESRPSLNGCDRGRHGLPRGTAVQMLSVSHLHMVCRDLSQVNWQRGHGR